MEAGGRLHDRATDRASGVVDENVDVAKVAQDLGAAFVDRFQIGQIARVDMRFAAGLFENVARLFELLAGTGDENDPVAGSLPLLVDDKANAARRAGEHRNLYGYPLTPPPRPPGVSPKRQEKP